MTNWYKNSVHNKNYLRLTAGRSLEGAMGILFLVETENLNGLDYKINYKYKANAALTTNLRGTVEGITSQ